MDLKRTKIVATLGPATASSEMIENLMKAGVNTFRLNFSHGSHESHGQLIQWIKEIRQKLQLPVAILQDLSGPKIRVGKIKESSIQLQPGDSIILDASLNENRENRIPVSHPRFAEDVKKSDILMLADGEIELKIIEVKSPQVICQVITGGELSSGKGINYPGGSFNLPAITEKDENDLQFGLEQGVDFVALSFVRTVADIEKARKIIDRHPSQVHLIAKIEKHEAINNFAEILQRVDGIMVARGDLGVEIPIEQVPLIQKRIIKMCNKAGKPVITATQMLRSMVNSTRPTRAEVTDVANAILDGSDAVMLSEETAIGEYPLKTVMMTSRIAQFIEEHFPFYRKILQEDEQTSSIPEAISHNATILAMSLGTRVIVCPTSSGFTARMMSRFRPKSYILALTPDEHTFYQLSLVWNVFPRLFPFEKHTEKLLKNALAFAEEENLISHGEKYIITAGFPFGIGGSTNLIQAGILGEEFPVNGDVE